MLDKILIFLFCSVFIFVCFFLEPLLEKRKKKQKESLYTKGYKSAEKVYYTTYLTAQEIYDQSLNSIKEDKFDIGWKTFCLEKGAKNINYE